VGGVGELLVGDCVEGMRGLAERSIDAVVCDPPYGLGFMGKQWDALPPGLEWARELFRICKPGAHVVAFGGQRTIHRLTCALEDAGFDVRDQLQWLQWQGFPKSLDLGKAVPKELMKGALAGARRYLGGEAVDEVLAEVARRWTGVGTALKPAAEPAVLCRRPVEGTIVANALAWGVGGLRIDDCRYAYGDSAWPGPTSEAQARAKHASVEGLASRRHGVVYSRHDAPRNDGFNLRGRWPANVYYCPKPSTAERERGLEHLARATPGELTGGRAEGSAGLSSPRAGAGRTARKGRANTHPTVKPVGLMRWLVRLVCPPGGLVLDPFLGSGTTAIACGLEGRRVLGFELSDEYATIAEARVAGWAGDFA
jgi:site-specific DNA-methyltransferase (adenine-specific)